MLQRARGRAVSARIPRAVAVLLTLLASSVVLNSIDRSNLSVAAPLLKKELRAGELCRIEPVVWRGGVLAQNR